MILYTILFLVLGFIGLFYGAKLVVIGLENVAYRLGVSHLLVGLTILAVGTSLPEIAVSVIGGIDKITGIDPDIDGIVIGNKIGSFLTQITLIIGILGLSQNVFVSKWELRREIPMLFISLLIFLIFAFDGVLTRIEAFIMICVYILYLLLVIWSERKLTRAEPEIRCTERERLDPHCFEITDSPVKTSSIKIDIGFFLLGLIILLVGAEITIISGHALSKELNVPENVIGILVLGIGTSLPELVADLTAMRRESHGIAIGDILGSNICDILLATGLGAIISEFRVDSIIILFDIPILFIAISLTSYFLYTEKTLKKWEAALLISFFGFYTILKLMFFQI